MGTSSRLEVQRRIRSLGISQGEVAKVLGCSQSFMSHWFRGYIHGTDSFAQRVEAAVNLLREANEAAEEARNRVLFHDEVDQGGEKNQMEVQDLGDLRVRRV